MPESIHPEDPIKNKLVYCQCIPVRWRKLEQELSDTQLLSMHSDNAKLMEVLVGSEDAAWDAEPAAIDKDAMKEIRKLDAKLNLLMGWMGSMLLQQMNVPQPQTVSLSTQGLQFHLSKDREGADLLCENDNLYMELFLEPRYPQAFTTLVKVFQVDSTSQGMDVTVRFIQLSEQNQQWLDRYVFQSHRRQVALSRKQSLL